MTIGKFYVLTFSFGFLFLNGCKTEENLKTDLSYSQELGFISAAIQTQIPSLIAFSSATQNDLYPSYFNQNYSDSITTDGNGIRWNTSSKQFQLRKDFLYTSGISHFYGNKSIGLLHDTTILSWEKSDSFLVKTEESQFQLIGSIKMLGNSPLEKTVLVNLKVITKEKSWDINSFFSLDIKPNNFKVNYLSSRILNGSATVSDLSNNLWLIDFENNENAENTNTLANSGIINLYLNNEFKGRLNTDPFSSKVADFVARFELNQQERIVKCW